ncbi:MAG: TonB-dependent receptor [Betaproteobacteria bacterium]|nr:TonB-dependent receptor [Betaproteobacteria bacterium]
MQKRKISLAVTQAISAGVLLGLAGHAGAQTAAAVTEKVEKVEVTGTRIPPPNLEGASPVTVVDAAAIKVDGLRSVENLLNNLPQVFADQGANVSNGASGTANVNLRGLGAQRTLVLINGRRMPAGSPRVGATTAAADLNQIPAPLIKRVEILTGGAASVYGSDAVAGVVNFIMNNKFEGVQVEANQSSFYHKQQNAQGVADIIAGRAKTNPAQFAVPGDANGDGKINDANLLMGSNFANGKGNATVFFSYKKEDALLEAARDFSACSLGTGSGGTVFTCGGSGTSYPGQFITAAGARTVADSSGHTRAYAGATDQFNFAPYNFYQRPSERYGFNAYMNYDVAEWANVYSEFSFHDDHTVAQIAPSGAFGVAVNLAFENPLLSADWKRDIGLTGPGTTGSVIILRRNQEGGGRQDDIRHTSFREVLGVKGDFGKGWNYDVFMQTAKVIYQETFKNDFSKVRIGRALDVVTGPGGVPVCRSFVDGTDLNCAPYNIFSLGGVTPAALNYLSTPGFQKGSTEQMVQGANISGDLGAYGFISPMAKNGMALSVGVEHRTEKQQLDTDLEFSSFDLAGSGGPTKGNVGKYSVKEYFGEFRAPLVEGAELAKLLSVNGSVRHSDFDTGQKTDSYGFGIEWAPVNQIRTRGSYARAVRAANINELFTAQGIGLFAMPNDPCGPTKSATAAQCALTGLPANRYGSAVLDNPAGQYNTLGGGNANLKPESSDSYTFGLVLEPVKNFAATIDYFDIKVKDVIGTVPPNTILTNCLTKSQFCNLITRDPLQSTLWLAGSQVVATNLNLGSLGIKGFDFGANYTFKMEGYGSMNINFIGTLVKEAMNEPVPGGGTYDCKGLHGPVCGVPTPKWRHKLRDTWSTPWNLDLSLTWRHIDSVKAESTSSSPLLTGTPNAIDNTLASRDYIDIAAIWSITKQLTLSAGINNLFDKDPPVASGGTLAGAFGNGNTYPQVYDAMGRRVFINATYKF